MSRSAGAPNGRPYIFAVFCGVGFVAEAPWYVSTVCGFWGGGARGLLFGVGEEVLGEGAGVEEVGEEEGAGAVEPGAEEG